MLNLLITLVCSVRALASISDLYSTRTHSFTTLCLSTSDDDSNSDTGRKPQATDAPTHHLGPARSSLRIAPLRCNNDVSFSVSRAHSRELSGPR